VLNVKAHRIDSISSFFIIYVSKLGSNIIIKYYFQLRKTPRGLFGVDIILYVCSMTNINSKIGIGASIIITLGCLLKTFHLQGAGITLLFGGLLFCLVFIPTLIYSEIKNKKLLSAVGYLFASTSIIGVIFKLMHWPGANFLMRWSVTIILFIIMPIYFISTYNDIVNEKNTEQDRLRKIFIGIFIVAFFGMWYAMIDLSR